MAKRKNVLVMMCDHHRYDALGFLGNPMAITPNLDELASRSVLFENCFNQSPVCSPARHSLATGRYAHAHGVLSNTHMPYPGMVTIGHALREIGYRRINLGHMHWKDLEMDTGFEPWISHDKWRRAMSGDVMTRYAWESDHITRRTTGGPSSRTREQYSGYYVANNAIEEISSAVENGDNFLCWAAFSEPHPPFYPPKEIYERIDQSKIELPEQSGEGNRPPSEYILKRRREWENLTEVEIRQMIAGYYGMVELVDGYIGMVMDHIDQLGIRDDTIVIWTVDHGDQLWEHELFLKFNMYEASVHVPLLVDIPGNPPGIRGELVEHVDIFPTICDLLGVEIPGTVQGRSLAPLLEGGPSAEWREAIFSQIRDVQMVRTKDMKLVLYAGKPGELYDIERDPCELDNLVTDPGYASTIESLRDRILDWERTNAPTAF
ncbi:MAG: sulfatase-like hydrolase/transferase [Theionarchaea archaeon]|nr:sulfatase-like hydrolase/transferase [Theionarchaea archaeon]